MNKDNLMQQAQHVWTMLDEMAENNPDGYRRFMEKQMKDAKQHIKSPEPAFSIKVNTLDRRVLYINICGWVRIPEPQSDSHPVPIKAGIVHKFETKKQQFHYIDVAVNDNVIKNSLRDKQFKEELILLAMSYINDSTEWDLMPDKYSILQEKYYGDETNKAKPSSQDDDTLRNQLFSISRESDNYDSTSTDPLPELSNLLGKISTGSENKPTSKNLIEEISSTVIQNPNQVDTYCTPQHQIQVFGHDPPMMIITINLPQTESVQECELDISQVDLNLIVPSKYKLLLKFPQKVQDDLAKATFNKKKGDLKIKIPIAS
ncbi:uncharacterized protein TRIADDRAFT_23555 [Trichoplax adhaerens]|uniref:PIH1 domain-containing protein 2 n=1 Tax=Trichoplax adhaerens TaxID=10228 RepID=B3RTI5_TRIAD|nr:hypothetical protein TRIADDRAFT_23555 [Trichoplax adhaerens]EDV25634.1 hypothetical protein TRIADDRAFT_23555 [Trichoplax adhaerens]|eukprot:XP_002111667.1 hypothetical protein TRIADDRAFT_23555 [Trichoplax adhaerens]